MSDQNQEEQAFEMPVYDAKMREGISKVGNNKEDMLPYGAFGRYHCRLTRLKRSRPGGAPAFIAEAVLTQDATVYPGREIEPGKEIEETAGATISFYFPLTLGQVYGDKSITKQRIQQKALVSLGEAVFSALLGKEGFNPLESLQEIANQGRLSDELSAQLTFVWERRKGKAMPNLRDGVPVHYGDDSITA